MSLMRKEVYTVNTLRLWLSAMELGRRAGCHQRADRSFFIGSWQFPVCARCTGVIAGHMIALLLRKSQLPRYLPITCSLTTLLDWMAQELGKPSTNFRRLVTGMLGGFGVGTVFIHTIRKIICSKKRR